MLNKYKVLAEVEINGSLQFVGTEVELSAEDAAPFIEAGQIEVVRESADVAEEIAASEETSATAEESSDEATA